MVRMLPVAIALIGTRLSAASVAFMGWFGPRGLASIVLGLVYLEQETHFPGEPTIRTSHAKSRRARNDRISELSSTPSRGPVPDDA